MRILIAAFALVAPLGAAPFEFENGDRVLLLGNTFFEREGNYGHLEARLAAGLAEKDLTFRNMGWSGDTVDCHARSYFGPPKEGFDRLRTNLGLVKPTVVIACYGSNAAFAGEPGRAAFIEGYQRLLSMIKETTGARIVLVSPPPCETLGAPLPDMTEQNERLSRYRDAIKGLAAREGYAFVDLFAKLGDGAAGEEELTDNGVHFTDSGYSAIAPGFAELFGIASDRLASEDYERMRDLIVEKNRLFFNRWRPQNETYLRGFRKHEQGQNARELAEFAPLIEEKDKEIQELAKKLSQ